MAHDIALGMQTRPDEKDALATFAKSVGASWMKEWTELGYYEVGEFDGWGDAFYRVLTITQQRAGKIHFDLTGLNIKVALEGDPALWVGRYTAWELQQIILHRDLFEMTHFYLGGSRLTAEQVEKLGIFAPS